MRCFDKLDKIEPILVFWIKNPNSYASKMRPKQAKREAYNQLSNPVHYNHEIIIKNNTSLETILSSVIVVP